MHTTTPSSTLTSRLSRIAAARWLQWLGLFAAIVSLSLVAIHPLLLGKMPLTDDGTTHLYRLISFDDSLRHGDLWPRYVASMAFGYGAPSFNYYSPVSLYPAEIFHLLGMSFLDALLGSMALYIVIGALGAYLLGKSWGGAMAGFGMSAAFTYAPYTIFNLLHRGALAEYAALALLPWTIWAFQNIACYGRRRDFMLAILGYSWMILVHNPTALTSTAILIPYSLYLWLTSASRTRTFLRLLGAGVMALGLTAFFWLPALREAAYVQLNRVTTGIYLSPNDPAFWQHFQSVWQTLAWPAATDLSRFNPPPQRTLGWPELVLGLLGTGLVLWRPRRDQPIDLRGWVAASILAVGLAVFMVTPASAWLWLHVPLIRLFAFPWRVLGPATFLLAALAGLGIGAAAQRISRPAGRAAWMAVCLTGIIVYAMPWLYRPYLSDLHASSIVDAQDYERQTGVIAGASFGDYLPREVVEVPDPNALTGLYASSDIIPRLQPLPGVITIEKEAWELTSGRLAFSSTEDTTLTFNWLYFPGWWAQLDGQSVETFSTQPNGFVAVKVPAGEHSLVIGLSPTPLEQMATIGSGLFLLLLLGILLFARLWPPAQPTGPAPPSAVLSPMPVMMAVVGIGVLLFALKTQIIDVYPTPIRRERFAAGAQAGAQIPIEASFEGQIELLGYDLAPRQLAPGQTAHFTLYWMPMPHSTIAGNYSSIITLRDAAGEVVAQASQTYPGGWRTTDFVDGQYVPDRIDLLIPPGTPPAQYSLDASLFWVAEGRSLSVFNLEGTPLGQFAPLGTLAVDHPARPASIDDFTHGDSASLRHAPLTDDIELLTAGSPPSAGDVGQQIVLLLGWQARQRPAQAYTFHVCWLADDGQQAAASPVLPLTLNYPTDLWTKGDIWRSVHSLYIPGSLKTGSYKVAIQLVDEAGEPVGAKAVIGQMIVNTPPRSYDVPSMGTTADASWQDGIRLLGYDLASEGVRPGNSFDLTLYWQTDQNITTGLKIFVHLYASDGTIIAQQDAIPLGGTRPTTGWAPGEVLTDHYTITVPPGTPPGSYLLRVGLYDAVTGTRAHLLDDSEFWILPRHIQIPGG
jgi:hypothetical protein